MRIIRTDLLDPAVLSSDENHWVYNGLDAALTREIFDNLSPLVDETSRKTYEFSKALQAPVAEMMLRGLLVNQNRRREVLGKMRKDRARLDMQFQQLVQEGVGVGYVNAGSPHQVGRLLYDVMGLPVQKKRKSDGSYGRTADREALEKLLVYYIAEPIIAHILAIRDLAKSISFLETGIDPDGRMRTSINIAGTNTGRWSSSESDYETGTNLQNVTESLRSVFVADPGYKFANLDLEQGDSRNVGALCWNILVANPDWSEQSAGRYLDACESGDLHTTVTRMVQPRLPWGTAPDKEIAERDFVRGKSYRQASKVLGHGSNYLGTPPTMAKHSKFPLAAVKDFQRDYFAAFPCIVGYHAWVAHQIKQFAMIETLFGRRRFFFGRPMEGTTLREATAYAPQSMTADAINTGILALWRSNKPIHLLMQVHDSILFQYPEELEDEIIPWALEALKARLRLKRDREFFVPTEAKVGWNWGNESPDNVDGLKKWKASAPDMRIRNETSFRLSLSAL